MGDIPLLSIGPSGVTPPEQQKVLSPKVTVPAKRIGKITRRLDIEPKTIKHGVDKIVAFPTSSTDIISSFKGERADLSVFLAHAKNGCISKEKTFEKELTTMDAINQNISEKELAFLDTTYRRAVLTANNTIFVLKGSVRASGIKGILKDRGIGDCEDIIRKSVEAVPLDTRISLTKDFFRGLAALHGAGFVHGDIKPENFLVYKDAIKPEDATKESDLHLKISDWGKTKRVKPGETLPVRGNLRFAAPEGRLSRQSEVFSAALAAIRFVEESIDMNELPKVKEKDKETDAIPKRRGIEKFIVEHKAFMGCDEDTVQKKLFVRLPRQAKLDKLSSKQKKEQYTALTNYVDELTKRLNFPEEKQQDLNILLKVMLHPNPENRPTMAMASAHFSSIFTLAPPQKEVPSA